MIFVQSLFATHRYTHWNQSISWQSRQRTGPELGYRKAQSQQVRWIVSLWGFAMAQRSCRGEGAHSCSALSSSNVATQGMRPLPSEGAHSCGRCARPARRATGPFSSETGEAPLEGTYSCGRWVRQAQRDERSAPCVKR